MRQNSTENEQNFCDKWNMTSMFYDIDSLILKIFYPTRWTVRAASLSSILKNYGTLMKLWGWAQDNVNDSDMKARIIVVQTKMQTFSFFYELQLAIIVLSHSDKLRSSLQRAKLYAVDAQKNAKLSVTVLRGIHSDRYASLNWTKVTQVAVKLELQASSLLCAIRYHQGILRVMLYESTIPIERTFTARSTLKLWTL